MTDVQAALTRDIQETMRAWSPQLRECALIFVHAPSANAAPLFHGEAPPLDRGDPRVRSVPFTTRRPTFSETKRVAQTLLTVTASEAPAALLPPPPGMIPLLLHGCSVLLSAMRSAFSGLIRHDRPNHPCADEMPPPCRGSQGKADTTAKAAAAEK